MSQPIPLAGLEPAPVIKANGREISLELMDELVFAQVEASVGATSRFALRFDGIESDAATIFPIGAAVTISFDNMQGESTEVFQGDVTSTAIEIREGRDELLISGLDGRYKLGSNVQVRSFVNQSYGAVLKKVAGDAGLSAKIDSSLDKPTFEHLLQTTTNQEFVADIARRAGMDWFVEGKQLNVRPRAKSAPVATFSWGAELRNFSARYSQSEHPSAVEVRGWDPSSKKEIVGAGSAPLKKPFDEATAESDGRKKVAGTRKAMSWRGPILSQAEGKSIAEGIARRMVAAELTGRGEAIGTPELAPGSRVEIDKVGDAWSGKYYVTSTEHVFGRGQEYVTRFTVGSLEPSSLVDLIGAGGTPRSDPLTAGVTIGVVTNNDDTDGQLGRVKVKFPYLDPKTESAWARVATIGGGPQRGLMFHPEVDDEVLVAFEHGDVRRPYVVGSLWNGKDKPPLAKPVEKKKVPERTIVSRLGHTLRFMDGEKDADKFVSLELADGTTKLHVAHDKIELIANGKPVEIKNNKNNASVLLTDGGDVRLKGNKVTIEATSDIELKGANVKVTAKANAAVTANAKLDLKSNAPATVESSAILNLKGAMVKVN